MFEEKYELTNETIEHEGRTLYRIRAIRYFNDVKVGDLGGFVENEENLSHDGDCWIYDDAMAIDLAWIHGDAQLRNQSIAMDAAELFGLAVLADSAVACDQTCIYGAARLSGHAKACDYSHVFGNAVLSGDDVIDGHRVTYGSQRRHKCDLRHARPSK